jgi:iron only hydrogenase large subunit-like protein
MAHSKKYTKLVYTVKDRCRVCYTCVRECPVKAIRIFNGQAEVIPERCIACGNCVKVCSQDAKVFIDSREQVKILLKGERPVYGIIAPSFPAEFTDISDYRTLVGMIRKLGFDRVIEVSFGADMVAREYNKILGNNGSKHYISSDCPAIVNFIPRSNCFADGCALPGDPEKIRRRTAYHLYWSLHCKKSRNR